MVELAELHLQYITDETGEKTSVIVPLAEFQDSWRISRTLPPWQRGVRNPRFHMKSW